MDYTALITIVGQLGLGAAAWRLANKVAQRQEATDQRVDGHETRIVYLERKSA